MAKPLQLWMHGLSGSTQPADYFLHPLSFPMLLLPWWVEKTIQTVPDLTFQADLAYSTINGYYAIRLIDNVMDGDVDVDLALLPALSFFHSQFQFSYQPYFSADHPFWEDFHTHWLRSAEAAMQDARLPQIDRACFVRVAAQKVCAAKLPIAAVALACRHAALLPRLFEMMDRLNFVFQTRREILSLRRDLFGGVMTYPILRTMAAAGIPVQAPVAPEQVLGAMLLTGSVRTICQESLADLARCREIAGELCLPTWLAYFETVEAITRELQDLFSLSAAGSPSPSARPSHTTFLPYEDSLADAIKRAEGYLLSDLTFRESWEVQRHVVPNLPEVTSRAFPSGLILEVLCANGHDLGPQVDEIFSILERDGFRYYDNYHIPPDADDLGLLLRLHRYASQKPACRELLQKPLGWMERNVLPTGEIPVYFSRNVDAPIAPGKFWATRCLTVEINLLLGLIDYDWQRFHALVEDAAQYLFDHLLWNGLGLTTNYDLLYALWALVRLIEQLSGCSIKPALRDQLEPAGVTVHRRLAQAAVRRLTSPQDAAFLTLACLGHATESLFDPGWITVLLKGQRFDGSWEAEPFYPTPNRNGVPTWYASRSITTAYCYHALQAFRGHKQP